MEPSQPTERSAGPGGLNAGEWRDFGSAAPRADAPRAAAPARRLSAARLHTNARPASLAVERDRAREIVGLARDTVTETFSEIRFGRKIQAANLAPSSRRSPPRSRAAPPPCLASRASSCTTNIPISIRSLSAG